MLILCVLRIPTVFIKLYRHNNPGNSLLFRYNGVILTRNCHKIYVDFLVVIP